MQFLIATATAFAAGAAALGPLDSLLNRAPSTSRNVQPRADTWGGAVSLGPSTSTIIEAVTTLTPGEAPPTQGGVLFLWPGMSNGTGCLIQTTLESWEDNAWCGASSGEWCVRASTFGSFGQIDGEGSPVTGADRVKIAYKVNDNVWTQTVTNADTGDLLSTLDTDVGEGATMTGYGTGTECNDQCTGTVAEQTYENTVITLLEADPSFGDTIAVSQGATYTGLTSSEGGKVWTIASMNIPAMG